ncbi:hypothetical protein KIN20_006158, partial [Parelaphostrongylus tenuis]
LEMVSTNSKKQNDITKATLMKHNCRDLNTDANHRQLWCQLDSEKVINMIPCLCVESNNDADFYWIAIIVVLYQDLIRIYEHHNG